MDIYLDDHYPATAAFGCDYFTRAAQGDIRIEGPDGPIFRREKVLITDRELDYEGRICVGERTVRHLAHKLSMVDQWRVERIVDDNTALRAELVGLSEEVADLRRQIKFLRELEAAPAEQVYLALDGSRHASERACMEATAAMLDITTEMIASAKPVPLEPEGASS